MGKVGIVGWRNAPEPVLGHVERTARSLVGQGHRIITGGAPGVDMAAARGGAECNPGLVTIHLPWPTFNEDDVYPLRTLGVNVIDRPYPADELMDKLWLKYRGSAWRRERHTTRLLMMRNLHIATDAHSMLIALPQVSPTTRKPIGGTAFPIFVATSEINTNQVLRVIDAETPIRAWDLCPACGVWTRLPACGARYHSLKPFTDEYFVKIA